MKKVLSAILALTMCLILFSCGDTSPSGTVDSYLTALKTKDTKTATDLYLGSDPNMFKNTTGEDEELYNAIEGRLLDFDYEVLEERIDGDKAEVDVKITTYNLGNVLTESISEYFSQAVEMAFSGASDEELQDLYLEMFTAKLDAAGKDYVKTVTVSLTQTDGKWKINEFEEGGEFQDAICGGILSVFSGLEDAFSMEE